MGVCNIRSLLIAAIVLCNCITWTASRHHYTHNVLRHRSRHRRQGAGLYLAASYILPGGEGAGAWGPWGEVSPCSRTCGGGVASQKRICLEVGSDGRPLCTGGDTKYFSCQTQDCPEGSKDYRAEQCSEFDNEYFSGVQYQWVPYTTGLNPCALNCKPRGERFYNQLRKAVVDGTRCNEESFDVCVNGTCQPVGCDMMLGSSAREDKCRECRGNNTNCHSVQGRIDSQNYTKGYNDILLIPAGATTILIQETRPSNNYLALRSKQEQTYYLNGNYHIDFPRSIVIAGALWQYERSHTGLPAPDKLRCPGPTNEPLYLSVLLQDDSVGVDYEYSIPKSQAPPPDQQYGWVFESFTPCSVTCGGGIQYRKVTCRSREELKEVDSSLCDEGMKPATNQTCSGDPCPARWVEGPWGPCSKPCGEGGTRSRYVQCQKVITNGYASNVNDSECLRQLGPKPDLYQECNKNESCPTWFTGPWKPCDQLCGEGKQTRQVVCHQKINGRVQVFSDSDCSEERPAGEQNCILHPCEGVDWVVSDWTGCDSCLSKVRSRHLECVTLEKKVVNSSFCANHPKPILEEDCDRTKLPPCTVQWYATQWSNCSVECGKGVQTRRVFCGLFDGSSVIKVDDARCGNETKYKDFRPCEVPEEKCPAKWFAGPWSECTKECGGGEQYRRIMCLKGSLEATDCDPETILDNNQACNTGPCDKDETLPLNARTTPIMDEDYDDEDCEEGDEELEEEDEVEKEDRYQEEGLEADKEETASTDLDGMFSDSPSTEEGSGTGSTSFTELESEFTSESGSGSEPTISTESLETEASGSSSSDVDGSTTLGLGSTTEESIATRDKNSTLKTTTRDPHITTVEDVREPFDPRKSTTVASTDVSGSSSSDSANEEETSSSDTSTESYSTTDSSTDESSTISEESSTTDGLSTTDSSSTDTESTDSTTESSTETTGESSTASDELSTTEGLSTTEALSTTDASSTVADGTVSTESSSEFSTDTTGESSTTSDGYSTTEGVSASDESSTSTDSTVSTESTSESSTETTIESSTSSDGLSTTDSTSSTDDLSTVTGETFSTVTEETFSTESTSESSTKTTEESSTSSDELSTTEGLSTTEESSSDTDSDSSTTPYDFFTTLESFTKRPRCKARKKPKCVKSKFGCCPDKRTPAAGPFDAGCPNPKTCKEAKFGCCPDGVSPAQGPNNKECPLPPCNETLYGCCKSDGKTPAEGNDQEGCPPPRPKCEASKFGCCKDNKTQAKGPKGKGCPETQPKKGCAKSTHGCCHDNATAATGPNGEGCPCAATEFGCCPDNVSPARGPQMEGCVLNCNTSAFGCCPDGETPAHGPEYEGCCQLYSFGCCPDNYKPAEGPRLQGCGCQYAHFGCCPDNVTIARGNQNEGCGCQYSEYGCCPDRHTEATGPNFEGCDCHTYQFGCCPDGSTIAKGPALQGCHCSQSEHGCCGDGQTAAQGPDFAGCDCAASKYGCCPDGQTEATGPKFLGCSDVPENRQASCSLDKDRGPCTNYSVSWYYDVTYGGCSRFWYGGCEGNGNRFSSQAECDDVCIHPSPKDACKLPKVKGACSNYYLNYYYDPVREQCGQFVYGGCLGNDNNFKTREDCQKQCEPAKSDDQCKLPIERGSCAGNFSRWGFNVNSGQCEQFTWGGCEGNGNRFGSEAACIHKCDPPGALKPECTLPQEVGNCTEKLARWSFSQTENRCVPFYYTGCNGNENNFVAEQHCTERCPSAYVPDTCALPAETGECGTYRERWYFDTAEDRCRQFYYGGCGGNGNNFNTEVECQRRCRQQQATTTTTPRPTAGQPSGKEFCFLEQDPGPCSQLETRWAYDARAGACAAFQYGGCGGNQNNFPSEEYCQHYCVNVQDLCQLPMSAGPCRGSEMRWFYDAASDSCSQFTYGGCEGNDNRFDSREQCEQRCRSGPQVAPATPTTTVVPVEDVPSECRSSPVEACTQAGEVWYYEPYRRECLPHDNAAVGRDCRNTNVYRSQEACERTCGSFRGITQVCRYPVDAGECTDYVAKYFFNETAQQCQPFTYGGCLGGPNRFSTVDECEDVCIPNTIGGEPSSTGDPCSVAYDAGPCRGYFIKWYFDRERGQCGQFIYGGCQGNENRFDTREECEGRCAAAPAPTQATPRPEPKEPESDVGPECTTPDSLTPCGDNSTTFYFDSGRGQCLRGEFGACRYANSYRSEEECERRCGAFRNYADVCHEPLDPGPCRASIPKYWYDAARGQCTVYAYGGCRGGPNRFSSAEECEELCAPAGPAARCLEPVNPGGPCSPLQLDSVRWYYHPDEAECVAFAYAGCHGNGNNFHNYHECASVCKLTVASCDGYEEECARLRCPSGVLRTPTADGCERCACAPEREGDCEQYARECAEMSCPFGVDRNSAGACERCSCKEHPCANYPCQEGDRCVAEPFRDPVTQAAWYKPTCRTVNKAGSCPPPDPSSAARECRRECNDDADCWEDNKCCTEGCSQLCLQPYSATTAWYTTPRTTTYVPELPQAPRPNAETVPQVNATEEGKATLRCLFHGNPPPKITWQRGLVTIDGTVGRYRLHSDGALEIVSLYRNDSGVYICIADNELGTARQEINLQVADPVEQPAGISGDEDTRVTGELGQALVIRCLAFGYPTPTVAWYRGANMVPYSSHQYEARGNFLQIKTLELETLGEYACQAFNGLGKPASWSVVVQAFRPAGAGGFLLDSPFLVEREPAVVRVTPRPPPPPTAAVAPPPPPRQPEPEVPVYTVPVQTNLGVVEPSYQSGSDLSIGCDVDGYPTPEVYWTKDGVPLHSDDRVHLTDSRLTIQRASPADSGEYGCHARNEYTSHYALAQVNVEGTYIPSWCNDNPFFANCKLIVRSKFCHHNYYSRFCCKSCVESGQMTLSEAQALRENNNK